MTITAETEPGQGGRVLIVEDEPELLEPLDYSLRKAGFTTFSAADGLNACRQVGACRPELILLDIMLPDLDGWEVCRMIRSHPDERVASIPIIMLTALTATDNKLKGLELGADAYLPKPYSMKEVILQARNLVARRRQQTRLLDEVARLGSRSGVWHDIQDMVFHELRNHLLVIGGFSDVLSRDIPGLGQDRSRSHLEAIRRSSRYLVNLAEEFLMMRKVESGSLVLPRQLVELGALVGEVAKLFEPVAEDRRVQLQVGCEPARGTVLLNAAALKVVLANLLGNAIHYSGAGTTVRLGCLLDGAERLCLEVQDQGPGIPHDEQARIFERYYRGRGQQETTRGSGLGLYIARTLAEAMGGRVGLSSEPGLGSCFRVVLPLPSSAGAGVVPQRRLQ
ncbi:hybrid sensor histidine kinase/response regulator [Desulfuromonas versatilis]|uniref:histidine kinase n=1 Tax=Desulfuromonas versatilis TaxID=2802975 RepID=A0ABN6E7Z8_9BACT|nr:ATP-binding protein [Desulfuromonas versatilis]BCR06806.1 hybrid sensor histidine kinase/response regulator [Desulfuromonas versatilis]